ncbi:MAG: efflux RND transporter permease subunit [Flavobacterium sp.]
MNMIRFALRKPISIMVLVAGLLFFGIGAVRSVKIDILPQMNLPVIYLAHSFAGYTPDQMEAYFAKNYVNVMSFANGVKSIDTKNIQGLTLMKVTYYEDTNMAQAAAEISALSNRIQSRFPPGSQPPFIIRFDASSLPIGQLVLSSKSKSNDQLQDIANMQVRSTFTAIPGLLSPPPFGGSPRTIEINVNPDLLRSHQLTVEQVVTAIRNNNITAPSGNLRAGDTNYIIPTNNTIKKIKDFETIPLFKDGVENLYLSDVATVKDGADITAGYALVNGKRSVYISIAKAGDASTWDVVEKLKEELPKIQSTLPDDVELSYEFDQSVHVINSVKSLVLEGVIGATLTGLMVLLFLGDKRAALIVILTIPIAIISSVLFLKLFGQTINLMSLSGLALAIGILVDESTVTIENIHQHLDMGKPKALAIWDACKEIALPKLLILLCILAVFAPAFTMVGIPGALFLPLALSIGFAMTISFLLSQTFVPVMANWLMKEHKSAKTSTDEEIFEDSGLTLESEEDTMNQKRILVQREDFNNDGKISFFEKFRNGYMKLIHQLLVYKRMASIIYLVASVALVAILIGTIGQDVFPRGNSSQFQMRMRAPDGTRLEVTEDKAKMLLQELEKMVGKEHIQISSVYVGQHPGIFSVSPIYLFTAGPHEAVFQVALKEYDVEMDDFKDQLRAKVKEALPDVKMSFEPIDLTDKVLSQGSPTPIEVRIAGKNKKQNEKYAKLLMANMNQVDYLRDIQIAQPVNYPALDINIDRIRAAQLGVDMNDISKSLIASTSSSQYTDKIIWIDEKAGFSYNVQVQVPLNQMKSESDLLQIPLLKNQSRPILSDVAVVTPTTTHGQNDNIGARPYLSVTANVHDNDLGTASKAVQKSIENLGELPKGLFIEQIGLTTVLKDTMESLQIGLLIAIIVILLMLTANFQNFKTALVIVTTVPAVILGSLLMLMITGATLNLQSYMGIIMAVGVSIANAVLLITNAEQLRKHNGNAMQSAREAASLRIRPIIMTTIAMIAGMLPLAIGHGEGGDQIAPLGRAVIGGLLFSTFAVLLILPLIYGWAMKKSTTQSISLDPEDLESIHYIPSINSSNEK